MTFASGDKAVSLGDNLFMQCWRLMEVTLPQKTDSISTGMFESCLSLSSLYIPNSVTSIGGNAFSNCKSLRDIYFGGSEAEWSRVSKMADVTLALKNMTVHYNSPAPDLPGAHTHTVQTVGEKQATCTEPGYTGDKVCGVCGETLETGMVIPALGHRWDGGKITKQPTTTEKGLKTYTCTACGKTKNEEIPAAGSPGTPDKPTTPVISFADVPAGEYFAEPVNWAVARGVTNGTGTDDAGNNYFSPGDSCTRAQAVTFLWRAAGQPEPENAKNPFGDVPADQYYYKAVLWAVEKGITNGISDTEFGSDGEVTRGQMVTFLWRMHEMPAAASSTFADVPVSAYYYNAVGWAVSQGITNGTDEKANTFEPNTICSRAHIVTFLYRDQAG